MFLHVTNVVYFEAYKLRLEFNDGTVLVPAGMFVGTSLILRQAGRLLYGCRPPRTEGSRQIVELTGIGGGVEEEDESLTAGVLREAQEEMGCSVRLLPCRETVVVRGPDHVERMALQGEERPAAVVFRRFRTPSHQPWDADNKGEACPQTAGLRCGADRRRFGLPA